MGVAAGVAGSGGGDYVHAATAWATNADLIADCHRLGYLRDADHVLDPTHGKGNWWKVWRPEKLTALNRAEDGSDFRCLPYPAGAFDAIAYDPPYVCPGGRKTSNIKEMHDRYGMAEGGFEDPDFRTPAELQAIINDGLTEMARLVRPRGVVLLKCKDYIWSGKFWPGTHHTLSHALALGFELVDRLEHIGTPGPQSQTRQVHARRNLSTLFVFRAAKALTAPVLDFDAPVTPSVETVGEVP